MQNLFHAFFGVAIAISADLIGGFGKPLFGEFESASVMLYVSKEQNNLTRAALASFFMLVQLIGAAAFIYGIQISDRLATGKPYPGETWFSVFWFVFGGLGCVFIQQVTGLISAATGLNMARFINAL